MHTSKAVKISARGPDGVQYNHLSNVSEDVAVKLAEEYKDSIQMGTILDKWLHNNLSFLPKPDKDKYKLSRMCMTMWSKKKKDHFQKVMEQSIK